jgi:hypothetical protein
MINGDDDDEANAPPDDEEAEEVAAAANNDSTEGVNQKAPRMNNTLINTANEYGNVPPLDEFSNDHHIPKPIYYYNILDDIMYWAHEIYEICEAKVDVAYK